MPDNASPDPDLHRAPRFRRKNGAIRVRGCAREMMFSNHRRVSLYVRLESVAFWADRGIGLRSGENLIWTPILEEPDLSRDSSLEKKNQGPSHLTCGLISRQRPRAVGKWTRFTDLKWRILWKSTAGDERGHLPAQVVLLVAGTLTPSPSSTDQSRSQLRHVPFCQTLFLIREESTNSIILQGDRYLCQSSRVH